MEIIVKTATFQLQSIQRTFKPFQEVSSESGTRSRDKREIVNPFHGIGKVAEWAFGLTTHEHFYQLKSSVAENLNLLTNDGNKLSEAVHENSKEIQESIEMLKTFHEFLQNVAIQEQTRKRCLMRPQIHLL